jgi:hypothetical protein
MLIRKLPDVRADASAQWISAIPSWPVASKIASPAGKSWADARPQAARLDRMVPATVLGILAGGCTRQEEA